MAKIETQLFSEIRGKVKNLCFRFRKNGVIELSKNRIPANPRTEAQLTQREKYRNCVKQWNSLSEEKRQQYEEQAKPLGLSGYHVFMAECLKTAIKAFNYEITIDNTQNSNDLIDYQILLSIENDPQFFADCEGNQTFLEFYDEDQQTLLSHYVEEWDTENHNAKIWIKIPQIPANSTKKIYLKINTGRTGDLSNPNAVFDFYDGFEIWEGWVQHGKGEVVQDCTTAKVGNCSAYKKAYRDPNGAYKDIGKTLGRNIILEAWILRPPNPYDYNDRIGIIDNNGNGYGFMKRGWYNKIVVEKRTNYSARGIASASAYLLDGVWYWCQLIITDDKVIAQLIDSNNELKRAVATNTEYNQFTRVYIFGDYPCYVDEMRIRKFTDPEPSITYARL